MPTHKQDDAQSTLPPTGSGHERWFNRRSHDIEIRRDRYDYWVRGIRRNESYSQGTAGLEALLLLPITVPYVLIRDALIEPHAPWRVGLLRFEPDGGASPGVLMYDHPLDVDAVVATEVARLAQFVRSGDFDDAPVPPMWERVRAGMRRYPKDGYPKGSRRLL